MYEQQLTKMEGTSTYYYHNDHLGTPQMMTDASGVVVWSAEYKPFGEATVNPSSTTTNNLRFPGQYYDQETDLHYNYMRNYDPALGSYKQADPIGLDGGNNHLYIYVKNNPIRAIDPEGLECKEISQADRIKIVEMAKQWIGWKYKYGGDAKNGQTGIDCSRLVSRVYADAGFGYGDQATGEFPPAGYFKKSACDEGDVVLYSGHMGFYTGGRLLSARSGAGRVDYSPLTNPVYGYGKIKGCYRYCKEEKCK